MSEQKQISLFANATDHNRMAVQRAYEAARPWWKTAAMWAYLGLFVCYIFLICIWPYWGEDFYSFLSIGIVLAVYCGYALFWGSAAKAKNHEKRMQETYPGVSQMVVFNFYSDHAKAASSLNEQPERIEYDRIVLVKETGTQIILMRRQRIFYFMDKSGFCLGEADDFLRFLREKCPAAKFHLKK